MICPGDLSDPGHRIWQDVGDNASWNPESSVNMLTLEMQVTESSVNMLTLEMQVTETSDGSFDHTV